jgi:hypothetical protein
MQSFALDTIVLKKDKGKYPLGLYLEILEDKEKKWTIGDVSKGKISNKFRRSKKESPNFGFTTSVYWTRFQIANESDVETSWFLEIDYPFIDFIEIYIPSVKESHFKFRKSGDYLPFNQRDINYRNFVYKLNIPPVSSQIYYLRFETSGSMIFPLYLWSYDSLIDKIINEQILLWIYVGIIFVMFLYNLFIYFSLKDNNYLYYVLFICSYFFYQFTLNGLSFQYLWPNAIWWANYCLPMFMSVNIIWIMLFCRSFLDTKKHIQGLDKFLIVIFWCAIPCLFLSFILSYGTIIRIVTFFGMVAYFGIDSWCTIGSLLCIRMVFHINWNRYICRQNYRTPSQQFVYSL